MQRLASIFVAIVGLTSIGCDSPTEPASKSESDPAAEASRTCKHVVEIAGGTEAGKDEAVRAKVQVDCEASLAEIARRHASLTACMNAAGNLAEIEACEKPAQRYDSVLRSLGPTDVQVCQHIMDIMKGEMGDGATQPSAAELERGMSECAAAMAKERQKIGEEVFRDRAKCVMAAAKMEDMMKCDAKG